MKTPDAKQTCLLSPEQVIFTIPEATLPEVPDHHQTFGIIGQERAMQAIELALSIPSKGYNIFATGPTGTGKRTAIMHILKSLPLETEKLKDIVYVHNPIQEDSPRVLLFPKGQALKYRRAMRKIILDIQLLAQEIQSQSQFQLTKDEYILKAESEENQILFDFEDKIHQEGFKIVQFDEGDQEKTDLAALVNDNLANIQEIHQMAASGEIQEDHYQDLRETYFRLMDEMKQLFGEIQRRRRRVEQYMLDLLQKALEPEISQRFTDLVAQFPSEKLRSHLDDLIPDMLEHLPLFLADAERQIDPIEDQEEPAARSEPVDPDHKTAARRPKPPKNPRSKKKHSMDYSPERVSGIGDLALSVPLGGFHLPLGKHLVKQLASKPKAKPQNQKTRSLGNSSASTTGLYSGYNSALLHLPEHLLRYDVNVLIDHSSTEKPPVIFETYPDFQKLFGTIEAYGEHGAGGPGTQTHQSPGAALAAAMGLERPGFLALRPGSLLRANGGFLILQAEDLLMEEETYISLKRVLQNGTLEIRTNPGSPIVQGGSFLKPEPIPITLKVVILGNEMLYDALYMQDSDFQKLFKVPAEFDYTMERNVQTTREYLHFIRMVQADEQLLPVHQSAEAALLEYGVRLAEFRGELCTKFSLIADILREASYWTKREGATEITRQSIETALAKRAFLLNLPEEKIDEQISTGELLIQLEGSARGKVNGLAVLDRGYYSFGRPTVISAQVAPGSDGIINVEREAGLSGEIHDKGTYIVESYIHATYAQEFPFSITARICFEQSYVEVDGDSASSTEIYALLSAIAGVPLRQDIAVTGSVNQMGEIQPVGGVIEKVEGFFQVCKKKGLTGSQGVIIPKQNINSLILNREVNDAIQSGDFHIWAISHISQGIEILTGLPSGTRNTKGQFPEGTLNYLVEKQLRKMAKVSSKE
jgi:lon-related putative ATP-dependent protease